MTTNIASLNAEFLTRLRAFVRRRVRAEHDAEDIVQDVLTRLVQHDQTIDSRDDRAVAAWLFTVARRAIIDRSRTSVREGHADANDVAMVDPAEDPSASAELARCMEPMLAMLSNDDRVLLQRIDMVGESQADVARELGMSMSGLKSRVQRARQRLRAQLEGCCAIERDRLGQPADYQRRRDQPCPCDGCG
ncbi:MAG TPA: sigma-70 family RNA polymerase sigma factor [Phycisphaerales bacterium]|nr:sigma-70 family RNA polymerase sigma factor [Phycisphaerales bacterium]HRQ75773.1 sigma-70 family RNA polymerase sigma factor [Phycisphaerales bacterium]